MTSGDHDVDAAVSARAGEAIDRAHDAMVATRRDLHRHPELAHEERRTADVAASRAEALGFSVRTGLGGTGVIADMEGRGGGPTLMLRADMDALPVEERDDGRPVRSEIPGAMHACGHDGHVAIALGVAEALAAVRDAWNGRVRLCFQPAEEVAEGALPMIADGADDGVDRVLGIHLWSGLTAGRVAVTPGVIFGSADTFSLTVRGRGGHGGMPHNAVDPVVAAAQVVVALQTVVSRETAPLSPAVVTLGRVQGGQAPNVIADTVLLEGTVRAVEQLERERLLRRVAEIADGVARSLRAEAVFERGPGCPPVISDPEVADTVRRAAVSVLGDGQVDVAQPLTVGDDVACFLDRHPGCYFLVGAGRPGARNAPHHSADFDIDESCLRTGALTLTESALAILR